MSQRSVEEGLRRSVTVRMRVLTLLVAAGPVWGGTSIAAEHALTREEGVALALQKNEEIFIERESLSAAESAVTGARGVYDPLLEVEGGWRRIAEPVNSSFSGAPAGKAGTTTDGLYANASVRQLFPTGGAATFRALTLRETTDSTFALLTPSYDTQLGVELRQPLLRNRSVDSARMVLRVAVSERDGAFAALRRRISETIAEVEHAYWTLAAARQEIAVREEAVRLAEEQSGETRSRVEGGSAPETEAAQPRAELERRRGELLTSREAATRADNRLKSLILGDSDDPLWLADLTPNEDLPVEIVAVDVPASLARALEGRPELEIAEATVRRRRIETAFARDGVRPALDAVASYDRFGLAGTGNPTASPFPGAPVGVPAGLEGGLGRSFRNLGEGDFADARVGLLFGIPIGNRAAKATAARAESFERQAEADVSRARKAIRIEVLDAVAALETARQRIETARAGREAAEVQFSAERERYAVGFSTNFLVLTRQNDLSRARLEEISALADYRKARTELARATGSLLEERKIALDRSESR